MHAPVEYIVIAVMIVGRFLLPLLIARWPLPAILACLVLDAIDQTVFQTFTSFDLSPYQDYDKALDVLYLAIAYLSTLRNWQNRDAFEVSRFLFYYRLVGVVLFEVLQWRVLLFIFPNTFEYFFIAIESVRTYWDPRRLARRGVILLAAGIWVFIKLPQEYWIHVAQLDATDMLKTLFGVPPDASWLAAVANRPAMAVALAALVAAGAAVIRWVVIPRLPRPQHKLALAADPVPEEIDEPQEQRAVYARELKPWDHVTLEKICLIALVAIIFGQILPGFNETALPLAISVAIVVVINATISYWLARHDLGFGHIFKQFALMLAVNWGLGLIGFLLSTSHAGTSLAVTLFLLLLLTLLVTLYDRFRPIYNVRFERPAGEKATETVACG